MSISSSQSRLGSGTGAIPSYHTRWIAAPHSGSVKGIAAILVVAFLFRVGMLALLVHHPERAYRRDSGGYERPALNLLAGNGFSQEVAPPFTPDVRRTPLSPLFIAAIYGLIGPNAMAVVGAQVLVGTLTVALTCAMGWRLLPVGEAKAGGLLMALSLGPAVYCAFLLTETLFTALLLIVMYSLLYYWRGGRVWTLLAGGIVVGMCILCRPIALFYPLFVVPLIWALTRGRWVRKLFASLAFLGVSGVVIAPWLVRNYRVVGTPVLSSIADYNLLFYNAVALEADIRGEPEAVVRADMLREVEGELRSIGADEGTRLAVYRRRGLEIILSHPLRYAVVHLRQDLNSLLPNTTELLELAGLTEGGKGTLSVLNRYGPVAAVRHYFAGREWALPVLIFTAALLLLTYVGGLAGVVTLARRGEWLTLLLLLWPVVYFLAVPGAPSHPRFRVPVMPYICLLAGVGLVYLWSGIRGRLAAVHCG